MATIQASSMLFSKGLPSLRCRRGAVGATINVSKTRTAPLPLPNISVSSRGLMEELCIRNGYKIAPTSLQVENDHIMQRHSIIKPEDPTVVAKLYAIMEAVADRVEMHKNIGEQRDNWNHLLLTSLNAMTLAAATMAGVAATGAAAAGGASASAPVAALKLSSTMLYVATTGILLMVNKIQPSQLAEEQRNAARLFKQLHGEIQSILSLRTPNINDVNEAMDKVLALDKAYPLPLLGTMLQKFPSVVEPAVWWPQQRRKPRILGTRKVEGNGWNKKLEEEMREIAGVLRRKDISEYLRLGNKALRVNKILAMAGPLLTGLGALGSAFVGTAQHGSWAVMLGVLAGTLATAVNGMQHGGQVGMVFEMYRSNAGFFNMIEETIEANINERDVQRRENGELLELKLSLQLGRSPAELKHLAACKEEFASKLF